MGSGFISSRVSNETIVIICVAIVVLIIIYFVSRTLQRNKMNRRYEELHSDVEALRNNTLEYKYTKAKVFAKANPDITERLNDLTPKYASSNDKIELCEDLDEQVKEFVDSNQTKKAMALMDDLDENVSDTKERIRIVSKTLDHILSKETEVREFGNAFKARYRNLKAAYQNTRSNYYNSVDYFDSRLDEVENEFTSFEQWMRASEFDKAKSDGDKIAAHIDDLSEELTMAPDLYDKAKNIIPQAVAEVQSTKKEIAEENIDIEYLNVDETLDKAIKDLETCVRALNVGQFDQGTENLDRITETVLNLQDSLLAERSAYHEIHSDFANECHTIETIDVDLGSVKSLYVEIKDRFGLDDWTHRFNLADMQLKELNETKEVIRKQIEETKTPAVDMIAYYRQFCSDVEEFNKRIQEMKNRLFGATSDEARSQDQLLKCQLVLNKIRVDTAQHQLPNISKQYEEDVEHGEQMIRRLQTILSHSPLDLKTLNKEVQETIDFVYSLYNEAHQVIGVAVMVENAIVFANRYRSSYPTLDSDLTRAELFFQNGEYSEALKIAIQAIEDLHPGIYEKLVVRKDPAINNQA